MAEGEKLMLLGSHGKLRAGDSVSRLNASSDRTLTVRQESAGIAFRLQTDRENQSGIRDHARKTVNEQGVVLAAVSARDTQAADTGTR